jgi:hypothetical protein
MLCPAGGILGKPPVVANGREQPSMARGSGIRSGDLDTAVEFAGHAGGRGYNATAGADALARAVTDFSAIAARISALR